MSSVHHRSAVDVKYVKYAKCSVVIIVGSRMIVYGIMYGIVALLLIPTVGQSACRH